MNNSPIGVFDSGLGGLTVARAIIDKLPDEDIIYLGDTAHTPYGPRPIAQVRQLALAGLDALLDHGVKMLVIACNTATAAALADARERYWLNAHIPVVEVITPAAQTAAAITRNHKVGVIGTQTTVSSEAYLNALAAVPGLQVFQNACPKFVEFVENGVTTGSELMQVTEEYLVPLKAEGIDTLILGCTHYPLLTGVISQVMGAGVTLVSSSEETANLTYRRLVELDLLHSPEQANANAVAETGGAMGVVSGAGTAKDSGSECENSCAHSKYRFLSTDPTVRFAKLARRFLGPELNSLEAIEMRVTQ